MAVSHTKQINILHLLELKQLYLGWRNGGGEGRKGTLYSVRRQICDRFSKMAYLE